jgi:uncharacterized lipoprotein YmbA
MKYIMLSIVLVLAGCASPEVAKRDQLILKVPPELLERPQALKQL